MYTYVSCCLHCMLNGKFAIHNIPTRSDVVPSPASHTHTRTHACTHTHVFGHAIHYMHVHLFNTLVVNPLTGLSGCDISNKLSAAHLCNTPCVTCVTPTCNMCNTACVTCVTPHVRSSYRLGFIIERNERRAGWCSATGLNLSYTVLHKGRTLIFIEHRHATFCDKPPRHGGLT